MAQILLTIGAETDCGDIREYSPILFGHALSFQVKCP